MALPCLESAWAWAELSPDWARLPRPAPRQIRAPHPDPVQLPGRRPAPAADLRRAGLRLSAAVAIPPTLPAQNFVPAAAHRWLCQRRATALSAEPRILPMLG